MKHNRRIQVSFLDFRRRWTPSQLAQSYSHELVGGAVVRIKRSLSLCSPFPLFFHLLPFRNIGQTCPHREGDRATGVEARQSGEGCSGSRKGKPLHTSPYPASNYSPAFPLPSRFTRKSKNQGIRPCVCARASRGVGYLRPSRQPSPALCTSPHFSYGGPFLFGQLISDTYPVVDDYLPT